MLKKYEAIEGELHRRLCSGVYPIGTRLPAEQTFAREFAVNVNTLRRSLANLTDNGFIARTPGRGTVVVALPGSETSVGKVKVIYRTITDAPDSDRCRAAAATGNRFCETHPHIHVEAAPLLRTHALLAPSVPEMLGSPHPTVLRWGYYADYARHDAMLALDQFDDFVDIASDVDGRLVSRTFNGEGKQHVHSLPVQLGVWMMMANRSLIERLGLSLPDGETTWKEFTDLCEEITRRGSRENIRAIDLGILHGSQTITRFLPYFYSANGGQMLVDPATGEPRLDSSGNVKALEFLAGLYQRNLCHSDLRADAFLSEKAAFNLSELRDVFVRVRQQMPDADIVAVPYPVPRPGSPPYGVIRGDFVGILAQTVHNGRDRLAAWEFIKFLLSSEGQTLQYQASDVLPARTDLVSRVTGGNPLGRQFADYGLRYGAPTFDVPAIDDVHSVIRRVMVRAILGECSAADALAEGQELLQTYVFSREDERMAPDYRPSLVL